MKLATERLFYSVRLLSWTTAQLFWNYVNRSQSSSVQYHSFTAILSTMPNFRKFTATVTPLTAVTDASNARVKVSSN